MALAAVQAIGQTATIGGVITDASGAPVHGATVTILNDATQNRRIVESSLSGVYSVGLLPAGSYTVTVSAAGLQTVERRSFPLFVADSARLDFELQIAKIGQTITISADSVAVHSDAPAVATVIDRSFIDVLPLNGRAFNR